MTRWSGFGYFGVLDFFSIIFVEHLPASQRKHFSQNSEYDKPHHHTDGACRRRIEESQLGECCVDPGGTEDQLESDGATALPGLDQNSITISIEQCNHCQGHDSSNHAPRK
eukprot:266211_1